MKIDKNIAELVAELEYTIGSECYNPNSYNGYTGEEGCSFRYPVWVYQKGEHERYSWMIRNVLPDEVTSIKYKFGSNHLLIGRGLVAVLKLLEERYNLDFNELEKNRNK